MRPFLLCAVVAACSGVASTRLSIPAAQTDPSTTATSEPAIELAPLPALPPPEHAPSFRIAVISDLNSAYGSVTYNSDVHDATRALIERLHPDLVLITGDMVAGQKPGLDYAAMWKAFHGVVTEPLTAAGVSVAPTPGNHDAAPGVRFARERAEFAQQWGTPDRLAQVRWIDDSNYPFFYSFDYGGVFFASIDAVAVGPLSERQRQWLAAQLDRSDQSTKIVFGHLPVHAFAHERELEILNDAALSSLFSKHRVSAYISGHHHAYYPGAVNGTWHIAMPCLGSGTRSLIGTRHRSPTALVVLDIHQGVLVAPQALKAPDFTAAIERSTLPPRIELLGHRVVRDDIAGLCPNCESVSMSY